MSIPRMSSVPFSPTRPKRRTSDKLIFISCEGSVTEWEYFEKIVNMVFVDITSKVKIINVLEDTLRIRENRRTSEERRAISSSSPKNLVEKMDIYKQQHQDEYNFENHENDEFWIVMDVDNHTDSSIKDSAGVSNLDKWNSVLSECQEKNYNYAVSNPFFELWLLLHFDDVNQDDYNYAVNSNHKYESTSHYRERLSELRVPLKRDKHISSRHYAKYNKTAIYNAISRAENLDDSSCNWPQDLGTTVYRLLKSIAQLDEQYSS